jgi:hypothetical protein
MIFTTDAEMGAGKILNATAWKVSGGAVEFHFLNLFWLVPMGIEKLKPKPSLKSPVTPKSGHREMGDQRLVSS